MAIKGVFTPPYHPELNGIIEWANGKVVGILKKNFSNHSSTWNTYLPEVIFSYKITMHSSTGYNTFELMYGRKPALPPIFYISINNPGFSIYKDYF